MSIPNLPLNNEILFRAPSVAGGAFFVCGQREICKYTGYPLRCGAIVAYNSSIYTKEGKRENMKKLVSLVLALMLLAGFGFCALVPRLRRKEAE